MRMLYYRYVFACILTLYGIRINPPQETAHSPKALPVCHKINPHITLHDDAKLVGCRGSWQVTQNYRFTV